MAFRAVNAPGSRASGWPFGLLLMVNGCTDPRFAREPACDGGACASQQRDAQAGDGAAEAGSGDAPSFVRDMPGLYAVRIRFHSRSALDRSARFSHEIMLLAEVEADAEGRVKMTTRRCLDEGFSLSAVGRQSFRWMYPERLAPEHFELSLRDGSFRSEAPPRALGYSSSSPSGCTTSADLASDEPWLEGGRCTCGTDPLPQGADDCRIVDADLDGQPGLSVQHSGILSGINHVRVEDACQIVDGKLSTSGRHTARYIENYDFLELVCGHGGPCVPGTVVGCPARVNPVEFEPLPALTPEGAPWDCGAVLEQNRAGKLFSSEALSFPSGC